MRRRKPVERVQKRPFRANKEILSSQVRLVNDEGEMTGVKSLSAALGMANEAGLDLVEISPHADPPVCKIVDYGKLLFEREKKKKELKKHQKTVQLKEIKLRPKTDVHDYKFKVRHIREFLLDGNKVKVTVRFKGREMAFSYLGKQQIERIVEHTKDLASVEVNPKVEGRTMFMVLKPLRKSQIAGGGLGKVDEESFISTHVKEKALLKEASKVSNKVAQKEESKEEQPTKVEEQPTKVDDVKDKVDEKKVDE